ncbi:alpha/beta fold hydrolase [Pontivivens insulae]|uniref:Tropinesterase n=1 Tax=Pontivivens insulae TaxID=1639689 RepID=A0A2R8A6T1_9RHOB|nr:alpha/beta hydrolase [Pontivivens insulae]RED18040.1 pimeloyl-ACP methyl ester carboxylesterase [Pontivivens insulae]SPF27937.1 Tropinesterase [Pontivivens insulae]
MTWTTRPRSKIAGQAAIDLGDGPYHILMLHGVGLRAEAWSAQIDAFAATARVIAPDMPGHGQSGLPASRLTLTDYVQCAADVLASLQGPTIVVGHSMGSMLALDLAGHHADAVCGVVALNAVFQRSAAARDAVIKRADALDGESTPDPTATLTRWFGDAPSAERNACATWLREVDPSAYKMAYTAFANSTSPTPEALAALPCPACFITGSAEPNSTPDMSTRMADLTPRGEVAIVEGAAHMMPMTHAAEVNRIISNFMSKVV